MNEDTKKLAYRLYEINSGGKNDDYLKSLNLIREVYYHINSLKFNQQILVSNIKYYLDKEKLESLIEESKIKHHKMLFIRTGSINIDDIVAFNDKLPKVERLCILTKKFSATYSFTNFPKTVTNLHISTDNCEVDFTDFDKTNIKCLTMINTRTKNLNFYPKSLKFICSDKEIAHNTDLTQFGSFDGNKLVVDFCDMTEYYFNFKN